MYISGQRPCFCSIFPMVKQKDLVFPITDFKGELQISGI